jgi:hypothetical protein
MGLDFGSRSMRRASRVSWYRLSKLRVAVTGYKGGDLGRVRQHFRDSHQQEEQ